MSSINIKINKTTNQVEFTIDDRVITEEMSEKMTEICDLLYTDSNQFDEKKHMIKFFNILKIMIDFYILR